MSLDFERVVNSYSVQATKDKFFNDLTKDPTGESMKPMLYNTFDSPRLNLRYGSRQKKTPFGYSGRTATRWVLTLFTGLLTGLVAILIVISTESIGKLRSKIIDALWRHHGTEIGNFLIFMSVNLTLALLSASLCLYLAPAAAGSGIPQVKAYLNGIRVERFANARLFLVKVIGTILSVSSGLAIGPEGPLVHIGAILGASCAKLSNFVLGNFSGYMSRPMREFLTTDLSYFANDAERRDFVSIGAATGFAAAFGAPVGGLLFSMEEASTYFPKYMYLKTLVATSIATFCIAVHNGDLSQYSVISLGEVRVAVDDLFLSRAEQLPFYVLIGISGGILGGIFCRVWEHNQHLRMKYSSSSTSSRRFRLLEVLVVSIFTSCVLYLVPLAHWSCKAVTFDDDLVNTHTAQDPYEFHAHQFNCGVGDINELATIFFGPREEAISDILTNPAQFNQATLWTVGLVFYTLMCITLGTSIPSGIFMPTVLVGCSLGGAAGMNFREWMGPEFSPSTYALLGAAALLSGIQRSTVSLCVILVEGTGQTKVMIPVIITVVVARYVGDRITKEGLYDIAMDVFGYSYLEFRERSRYDIFQVKDVMTTSVITIGEMEQAKDVVKLLNQSDHEGFPVVNLDGEFVGLVRRDQLVALIECGIFEDANMSLSSRLMHLAYHIKDDRYDFVVEDTGSSSLDEDEYDSNAWYLAVKRSRGNLQDLSESLRADPCLPPLRYETDSYARVVRDAQGTLRLASVHPSCTEKYVNVAAVMNQGTYCVNTFTPLSKAHSMFTALGLRHLVVIGSGRKVEGILTRENLLRSHVRKVTGYDV